jgi:Uri superfamily endonuclease
MMAAFIERTEHLDYFNKLRHAQTGAIYVLQGVAGVGKSIFLRQCRLICKKENYPFLYLDLEKFSPAANAAETLQNFGKAFNHWNSFQQLLKLFKTHFSMPEEIFKCYQSPILNNPPHALPPEKKTFHLLQALSFWKKSQEYQFNTHIKHPEWFVLENLKILCREHPIVFVDAYEQAYENPRLSHHRLQIVADFHGSQLIPLNQSEQPLFVDWLDALLEWLSEQGVIIVMAGRQFSKTWERYQIPLLSISNPQPFSIIKKHNLLVNKSNILNIPAISGTYLLILEAKKSEEIRIGHFGKMIIEQGFYIYVGSAFGIGGLQSRIRRQLQPPRKKHWHIDYLRSATDLREAWFSIDEQRHECEWALALANLKNFSQPMKGFGSSDCKQSFSHLFYCKNTPPFEILQTYFFSNSPLQRAIF